MLFVDLGHSSFSAAVVTFIQVSSGDASWVEPWAVSRRLRYDGKFGPQCGSTEGALGVTWCRLVLLGGEGTAVGSAY